MIWTRKEMMQWWVRLKSIEKGEHIWVPADRIIMVEEQLLDDGQFLRTKVLIDTGHEPRLILIAQTADELLSVICKENE